MKSFKKITSLVLSLVILAGCLVSCDFINGNSDKYVASVKVVYATEDDAMKAAIDAISEATATLTVDGENLMLESTMKHQSASIDESYIYIDGVMYHATDVIAAGKNVYTYEKANVDEANKDAILSDIGVGANITPADFENSEMTTSGKKVTYTCSDISAESAESLTKIFASRFEGLSATVALEGADYTLEMENDKNTSSVLSCHFAITLNGQTYRVTMHVYYTYDYSAKVNIIAPAGADQYTEVSYEDIIG